MGNHHTPLEVVERLIGRPETVGEICRVNAKSPYQWRGASRGREAGDIPYAAHMRALLTYSDQHGLGLTAEHLIWGASEIEVDAILNARRLRMEAAE